VISEDLARVDVDDSARPDNEVIGHGGRSYQPPTL
jgi:hypothetical protein